MTREHDTFDQGYQTVERLQGELINSVYMPKEELQVVVGAVATGSHVLLEGVPGTGKTTLANAIAQSIDGEFGRVQGTPDKMPNDIIGNEVFNRATNEMEFRNGPVFADVLLVDEMNRLSAKSQSALLEAMQEGQVSSGNLTHVLKDPFIVLATQNPLELGQGVTPLTKANRDRFAVGLTMPAFDAQDMIKVETMNYRPTGVAKTDDIRQIRDLVIPSVAVHQGDKEFAAQVIERVRSNEAVNARETVLNGARPYMSAIRIAQAMALIGNRRVVESKDIQTALRYVLPHRTQPTNAAMRDQVNSAHIVQRVIEQTA